MSELSINKRMKVIKFYLQGYPYSEIVKKAGVSKGAVFNIISELKSGMYPEISTIPEEIEQLRDLATDIKRNNLSPVQASIGLSVLERLAAVRIEPADIEKCHTLLQALSSSEADLPAMARSILAIEEVKQKTGLTLEELEPKVVSLRQKAEELAPLIGEVEAKKKELTQLESKHSGLINTIKKLGNQESSLTKSVKTLAAEEVKLRSHVIDLEERARGADKKLLYARRDLKNLDKMGMRLQELSKFTAKLKEVSVHHDIKPEDLCSRLLKELAILAKCLGLESLVKERQTQMDSIRNEITKEQAEKESLHAYLKQLTIEKVNLETRITHYHKQLANDIATLSEASKTTIREINDSLKSGINVSLSEVNKLADEAVKVGKDVGRLEASIESLSWVKPLISMVRAENGLDDYRVRVIGLTVLRSMSSWLDENHGQDSTLYLLKSHINSAVVELEAWKS